MFLKGIFKSNREESTTDSDSDNPPISFAYSYSSSSTHKYSYDVFPSFSGQDVRRTFLSHFLERLKSKGIKTFIDNGIMRSESINSELKRAIRESRIAVVILSKNYASSSWCLNELQLIMECRDSLRQTVMTIFYEVEPSDVRKQTGEFGRAFKETCYGKTEEEKHRWRRALTQVAVIAGEHSVSWASEAEMILKIVMDVSNELPSSDFDRLVGVEAHVEKMKAMICLESDDVKIVGIWGPPGIGKTTIARALYNQVSCNFQLKYYKESLDVKYKWWIPPSPTDDNDLKNRLEDEIRTGVLDHRGMKVPDLLEAEERLKHQRVLLILDGVPANELEALEGLIEGLRFGSKVIVTTENLDSLRDNEIDPNQIYKVPFPSSEEAQQIFSYSAFGQSSPPRGYLEHAVQVTKIIIAPFPLGLKVLGSALRGKSEQEWKGTPARLKRYSDDNDITKAIGYAFDVLSEKHKTLLKSIAKLIRYQRQSVNNVILSLAEKDWDVEKGIQTLADLALISISSEGVLTIHHLVENVLEHPHPWGISEAERVSDVQELIKIIKEESLSNDWSI